MTPTMADHNETFSIPVMVEQTREYLQDYHGVPVVLRQEENTGVTCCYCGKRHDHDHGPGHVEAGCGQEDRSIGIVIGDRSFVPAYGYRIF